MKYLMNRRDGTVLMSSLSLHSNNNNAMILTINNLFVGFVSRIDHTINNSNMPFFIVTSIVLLSLDMLAMPPIYYPV